MGLFSKTPHDAADGDVREAKDEPKSTHTELAEGSMTVRRFAERKGLTPGQVGALLALEPGLMVDHALPEDELSALLDAALHGGV